MRYRFDVQKSINQLTPHYLGGRKLILFLQSCMSPLQKSNIAFNEWAKETRIEASMTSQVFKLEWFLNRKFKSYFVDPSDNIVVINGSKVGTPIYNQEAESVPESEQFKVRYESREGESSSIVPSPLYIEGDNTTTSEVSFTVLCPKLKIDSNNKLNGGLSLGEFKQILTSYIEKYRLASKTYKIVYNN